MKKARAEARQEMVDRVKDMAVFPEPPTGTRKGVLYTDVANDTGRKRALAAWKYWHDNNLSHPDRLTVYVYRMWPHTKSKKALPPAEGGGSAKNFSRANLTEDTFYGFPPDYEYVDGEFNNLQHFVLSSWGSGNYRLTFYDSGLDTTLFKLMLNGIWDWEFLPRIPWDQLDIEHQNNKSFVQGLINRGMRLPGQPKQEEEPKQESDMATVVQQDPAVVGALVQLATQREKPSDPSDAIGKTNEAWSKVVGSIADTFREQQKSQQPGTQVRDLIDLAKMMVPQQVPQDTSKFFELMQSQAAAAQQRLDMLTAKIEEAQAGRMHAEVAALRQEIERVRHQPTGPPPASPQVTGLSGISELIEVVTKLSKLNTQIQDLTGRDDDPVRNPMSTPPWWAPFVPMGERLISTLVTALTVYMNRPLNNAPAVGVPAAVLPAQAPNPVQQPATAPATSTGDEQMSLYVQFLRTIAGPLLAHLDSPGKDGVDFALWFISGYPRTMYTQLASLGPAGLAGLIKLNGPELWARVSMPHPDMPGETTATTQFTTFLEEFCDQESVDKALRGESEDDPEPESAQVTNGVANGPVIIQTPTMASAGTPSVRRKG